MTLQSALKEVIWLIKVFLLGLNIIELDHEMAEMHLIKDHIP